ncbi:ABC transporter substrate-binding protein [Sphingomonas parva]|uniref:ABC transporter substrate-binding protein n=1 Tax=Sphingomonas parva TaxID=2555898 RepID=A0A4Y8ZYW5_9SPHN|nr:ABC transporter substrate-binding protein [Sphingomonas parva]TFI60219.1 ABC transporter substrate-binding protein [Sphingomonas parva]
MRVFAFASAISLLALAGAGDAAPRRAASLNLCTDELLLMLADTRQIASVTHLAQKPEETSLWREARRHRANDGSLVSVAAMKPDLVLTMGGGGRDRIRIAERLGIAVIDLPYPQSIGDVEAAIARVAGALGQAQRARPLLARIARLRTGTPARSVDTIWLAGGGRSVGPASLAGAWMALAGFRQRALPGDRATLEQLLVRPPSVLLRSDYRSGQYSGEQRWLSHPLAKVRSTRTIMTDGRPWTCMGPLLVGEIERLKGIRVPGARR